MDVRAKLVHGLKGTSEKSTCYPARNTTSLSTPIRSRFHHSGCPRGHENSFPNWLQFGNEGEHHPLALVLRQPRTCEQSCLEMGLGRNLFLSLARRANGMTKLWHHGAKRF